MRRPNRFKTHIEQTVIHLRAGKNTNIVFKKLFSSYGRSPGDISGLAGWWNAALRWAFFAGRR
jgi:hypothetical protein